MKIDVDNFRHWKKDEVTIEVMSALKDLRDQINEALTNADVVLGDNAAKAIPRLIGQREGLDLILEIQVEDLEDED